jgi:hypothetical protein
MSKSTTKWNKHMHKYDKTTIQLVLADCMFRKREYFFIFVDKPFQSTNESYVC